MRLFRQLSYPSRDIRFPLASVNVFRSESRIGVDAAMKLTHFFIDRPRFATVINIFITLIGLATMLFLPVAQYPEIVPPNVQVTTVYLGATAQTVAKTVATPLEQAINGVENMDYITSQSTGDGKITINATFKIGTDPNIAQMLTQNRVQDVMSRLPDEVQRQGIQVKKTIPAYLIGINPISPDGSRSLEYVSNYFTLHVKDELARLPGVADLFELGERQYAMRIWIDPNKAAVHDISASDILSALRAQNVQVSAGALNSPPIAGTGGYQINVEALGRLTTTDQYDDIIVKSDNDGRVTRIRDVGRAELGAADYTTISYSDGKPSTPFWAMAVPGSNVVTVEHEILDKMKEIRKAYPSGVGDIPMYDPTDFVTRSIEEVVLTIFIAILLVVGVVYLFLQNWRATIIPVIAIPVSLTGAFTILGALGTTINNLSLYGLVLAVGIVVDDAIVVVENVERNMSLGMSPREAAHRTMDEVSGALIAIALVLCAVFVPAAFIAGIPGLFFKQFATTIAASTVISCFVSLTLSPALCAVLLKPHPMDDHNKRGLEKHIQSVFKPLNAGFEWLSLAYGRLTARLVRATVVIAIAYLGLVSLTGFQLSRMSSGFIPEQDQGYLITLVQLPPGSSLDRTNKVTLEVADIISKTYGVEHVVPTIGFDVSTFSLAPNVATIYFALPSLNRHYLPGVNAAVVLKTIRQRLSQVHDANLITISPPPVQGLGGAGGFKLMLEDRGNLGPQELSKAANALVAAANNDPTFQDVFTPFNAGAPSIYADIAPILIWVKPSVAEPEALWQCREATGALVTV
jgi:hydrophobe/amphiphile efflux-1 (HAE1) family protein